VRALGKGRGGRDRDRACGVEDWAGTGRVECAGSTELIPSVCGGAGLL
jgi:hypothetical protein